MSVTTPAASEAAPLMLSVSGARGLIGRTMTPSVAAEYARSWASFVAERSGTAAPRIVLGRDSRPSGAMIADAARAGLAAAGAEVVDLGVVTTPTAGIMVGHLGAQAGLVVTASHNPIEWNGLKCLDASGVAPPARDAEQVIARFRAGDAPHAAVEALRPSTTDDTGHRVHVDRVLALVDVEAIRPSRFRVVLDSVNGAGCAAGRMLLEALGCEVVHLNGEPTGRFAHVPEPTAENLVELCDVMRREHAAVGFAQDPDADRLAIVDERGRYIGEEYTLVLAARALLETRGPGVMAANLSTSRMIDDLAARVEAPPVLRSAVGEANVAEAMRGAGGGLVGGEGNGGVIVPEVGWVRDSLSAMALVIEMLAREGRPLSTLVDEMPAYAMVKDKLDLAGVGGRAAVDGVLARVRDLRPGATVNDADGVRLDLPDEGAWVHVRPSNTEPILRIIAEAPREADARGLVEAVRGLL